MLFLRYYSQNFPIIGILMWLWCEITKLTDYFCSRTCWTASRPSWVWRPWPTSPWWWSTSRVWRGTNWLSWTLVILWLRLVKHDNYDFLSSGDMTMVTWRHEKLNILWLQSTFMWNIFSRLVYGTTWRKLAVNKYSNLVIFYWKNSLHLLYIL